MRRSRPVRLAGAVVAAVACAGLAFSATPAAAAAGSIRFQDDFEGTNFDQWEYQACVGSISHVTDLHHSGAKSAKFAVSENDTHSNCSAVPTQSPRAQLVSPELFGEGADNYIGFSTWFPSTFAKPADYLQIAELYGPPFAGSPTVGVDICGLRICLERDKTHNYDVIWTMNRDVARGQAWEDIILHVNFSTDPKKGFVEVWLNGVPQTMANGSTRTYYATLNRSVNYDGTPNTLNINSYRASGHHDGTVVLYHDDVRVGTTYDVVAR